MADQDSLPEVWLPVVGYESLYAVSDLGRVMSLSRVVPKAGYSGHTVAQRIRKTPPVEGYPSIGLNRLGECKTRRVCHLVCEAFIGPRPKGKEVCHNDGDKKNSRRANLRYDTPKANAQDRHKHGTQVFGELVPFAKLTSQQAIAIFHDTRPQRLVADEFCITRSNVSAIKRGISWNYSTGAPKYERSNPGTPRALERGNKERVQ